jgi:transcriptional regulator with XRE-family HTH domain
MQQLSRRGRVEHGRGLPGAVKAQRQPRRAAESPAHRDHRALIPLGCACRDRGAARLFRPISGTQRNHTETVASPTYAGCHTVCHADSVDDQQGVAERTVRARKLAGFSQRQLAEKAHVSLSLLRKVEQGNRPASPAFVAAVARALGRTPDALYGQPFEPTTQREAAVHAAIPELRRALVAFDDNDRPDPLPSLEELTAGLTRIRDAVRRARFGEATAALSDVLRGLHHVAELATDGQHRERIMAVLADGYSHTMGALYTLGYLDLAALAAERCRWAAAQSGDPLWPVVAEYNRAFILLYSGSYAAGLRVIDRAYLASEALPSKPNTLAVRGALHLRGSILAARATDAQNAEAHLAGARELAERLTDTLVEDYGTNFRLSNVDIHSVAVPVELCDGTTAVTRGARLLLPPETAPARLGHHHLDLARAWLLHGKRDQALTNLQEARRVAPELTRYHPQVHETIRALVRAERRRSDKLAAYACWAGVTA